jgi:acyl-CoA synthetase (AMP-forming)/AMP-acid ligase II
MSADFNAFVDGYLKTGDKGYFDEDGYLFLSGRLKELINRYGRVFFALGVKAVLADEMLLVDTDFVARNYPSKVEASTCVIPQHTSQATLPLPLPP